MKGLNLYVILTSLVGAMIIIVLSTILVFVMLRQALFQMGRGYFGSEAIEALKILGISGSKILMLCLLALSFNKIRLEFSLGFIGYKEMISWNLGYLSLIYIVLLLTGSLFSGYLWLRTEFKKKSLLSGLLTPIFAELGFIVLYPIAFFQVYISNLFYIRSSVIISWTCVSSIIHFLVGLTAVTILKGIAYGRTKKRGN